MLTNERASEVRLVVDIETAQQILPLVTELIIDEIVVLRSTELVGQLDGGYIWNFSNPKDVIDYSKMDYSKMEKAVQMSWYRNFESKAECFMSLSPQGEHQPQVTLC